MQKWHLFNFGGGRQSDVDIRKSEPWEEKDTETILWALKASREGGREEGARRTKSGSARLLSAALNFLRVLRF
jgi:hypothetical protein